MQCNSFISIFNFGINHTYSKVPSVYCDYNFIFEFHGFMFALNISHKYIEEQLLIPQIHHSRYHRVQMTPFYRSPLSSPPINSNQYKLQEDLSKKESIKNFIVRGFKVKETGAQQDLSPQVIDAKTGIQYMFSLLDQDFFHRIYHSVSYQVHLCSKPVLILRVEMAEEKSSVRNITWRSDF